MLRAPLLVLLSSATVLGCGRTGLVSDREGAALADAGNDTAAAIAVDDLAMGRDLADGHVAGPADLAAPADLAPSGPSQAVTFLVNVAHTAAQPGDRLAPPLTLLWSRQLRSSVSYPVIAAGKVFVTVGRRNPGVNPSLPSLLALDEDSGATVWGPVALGPSGTGWAAATYDDGRLFVLDTAGVLRAFDADSGRALWKVTLPRGDLSGAFWNAPPTAAGGVVYTSGMGRVSALDGASGALLWSTPVNGGDHSAPALGDGSLFVAYACADYRLDAADGQVRWTHGRCSGGGGGETALLTPTQVYARNVAYGNSVLAVATGSVLGTFVGFEPPAVSGTGRYFLAGRTLRRDDAGSVLWSFDGDGALATPPLVVGDLVYVGSGSGRLFAVDAASGSQRWSTNVGVAFTGAQRDGSANFGPPPALAEAHGLLVAPAGRSLFAFRAR
jgi:outer membrane protein assembly factor BamB